MKSDPHSISMHVARAIVDSARRHDMDVAALLRETSLTPSMVASAETRLTAEQFSRMLLHFWQQADDEFLGLASASSRHGTFTTMAKRTVFLRSLRAVYLHIGRFYHVINDALAFNLLEQDDEARFQLRLKDPSLDPDHVLVEFFLWLMHRFPSWLVGRNIRLKRVELAFPRPVHHVEYPLVFPCPVQFDAPENCLVMDASCLDAPIVQTEATLREHLKNAPLTWVTRQTYQPRFSRQVLDYIQRCDPPCEARMEEVAESLHITTRTLRRRLTEENTSFQALKDQVRRDEAIHLLSQPGVTIAEISRRLGFSDTAAFSRAFKSWTGEAPKFFRSR